MEEVEGKTEYIGSKQSEISHVSASHTDLIGGLSHSQKVTPPRATAECSVAAVPSCDTQIRNWSKSYLHTINSFVSSLSEDLTSPVL